jgi:hypothetical protein
MRGRGWFAATAGVVALLLAGAGAGPALAGAHPGLGRGGHGRVRAGALTAVAWGDDTAGELGDDSLAQSDVPVPVHGLSGAVAVAAGGRHDLALLGNGTVEAWGDDAFGELCNGTASADGDSEHPVPVTGLTGVTAVAAGEADSLFLLTNGTVMACGDNLSGQLGNGSFTSSSVPVPVTGLTGVTAIAAGSEFSVALLSNGTVEDWGTNGYGQLGDGKDGLAQERSDVPVAVKGLTGVAAIAAGGLNSAALLTNGTVMVWGDTLKSAAVPVPGLTGVTAVAAGTGIFGGPYFLALLADGTVMTWQLTGNGATAPAQVPGLAGVTAIAASAGGCCDSFDQLSMALEAGGTVETWGEGDFGSLGDGSTLSSLTPVAVKGLTGATAIAAGGVQAIALVPGTPPPASSGTGPFSSVWRQTAALPPVPRYGATQILTVPAISASSGTDAWAAGFQFSGKADADVPFATHFNGSTWAPSRVPLPQGVSTGEILGIDDLSPADVWAVGESIWHFNGHAWAIASAPGTPTTDYFTAVAGSSADDVWAVGSALGLAFDHFNGTSWQSVPAPTSGVGEFPELNAVAALSPSDAWAVGESRTESPHGGKGQTLTLHWNGTSWQAVPSPCLHDGTVVERICKFDDLNTLTGVAAVSKDNVWVSGYEGNPIRVPYVLHWNGKVWSLITLPNVGATGDTQLDGIAALSAGDIWVTGTSFGQTGLAYAVAEHYDGTTWSVSPVLYPGESSGVPDDYLGAIAAVAPHTLLTVGGLTLPDQGYGIYPLAEMSTHG